MLLKPRRLARASIIADNVVSGAQRLDAGQHEGRLETHLQSPIVQAEPKGFDRSEKMKRMKSLVTPLAAAVLAVVTIPHGAANAQMKCSVSIEIVKAGFIIGAGGGSGTLTCGDKKYRLEVGGIKAGLLIGAAKANLRGPVRNLHRVSDIEGTYAGAGAGIAVAGGVKGAVVKNEKGVELSLSGTQVGIEGGLDLSGTVVRLKH
jgi:hypothetical protein